VFFSILCAIFITGLFAGYTFYWRNTNFAGMLRFGCFCWRENTANRKKRKISCSFQWNCG